MSQLGRIPAACPFAPILPVYFPAANIVITHDVSVSSVMIFTDSFTALNLLKPLGFYFGLLPTHFIFLLHFLSMEYSNCLPAIYLCTQ